MEPKHFRARPLDRHADWTRWLTDDERTFGHSGLYRFYDANRRLLYVGISRHMEVRWSAHRTAAKWWPLARFVAVSFFPVGCGVWPDLAEKASIAHEDPQFNSNHKNPPRSTALRLHPYVPPPGFGD
ncbi:GIY-YIG nuclease family protein [Streptomyces anthocyanicus]|uniref:GIY-YIG nuclease family protein n=1 Tax=Streptomyces anthocyanicus TaxID=68174 RepID=UPI0038691F5E|nr:GIY-YIG nuclease family protein [Streptomyces anthocyanicus]